MLRGEGEKRNVVSNGYFEKPKTPFISPMGGHIQANLGPLRVPASVMSTLLRPSLQTTSLTGWVAYKDEFAIIEIQTQV